MSKIWQILIVEDDEEALASWKRDLREYNRERTNGNCFEASFAKDKKTALESIKKIRLHCAVVDLRLPANDQTKNDDRTPRGNDLIKQLLVVSGIPTVVYSGHIDELSEFAVTSPVRAIQKKKNGAMDALDWLAQHENLMSAMEETRERIARESAALFTKSIWPRWQSSWDLASKPGPLAEVITRQTVSHIADRLSLPETDFHPDEFYQIPALDEDRLSTGDLMTLDEKVVVVVTPRCNMANNSYPEYISLAHCKLMNSDWDSLKDAFASESKKKVDRANNKLRSYATQGHATGTHFLPQCGKDGPWLVDFKEIRTVPSATIKNLIENRFASISPGFVPNLVQRYAAYLGRIGQPDLNCDILRNQIMAKGIDD